MKLVFTLFLMCCFAYSMGQADMIQIGDKKFNTTLLSDNLTIYGALCENQQDYLSASRSIIRFDSITQKGNLNSYNYADRFNCKENTDHSAVDQIKTLISEKANDFNRIGILFSMDDINKKFIAVLYLFEKKKFEKFIKEANKIKTMDYAGEKISIREYNYRYAKEYILTKTGDIINFISVR